MAMLLAPAPASAMMVGAESNGELVNSNVSPEMQAVTLDKMKAQGAQVVRVNYGWNELAWACAGQEPAALANHANPCYTWGSLDSLVSLSNQRGIKVLFSGSRAPAWLHGTSDVYYLGASDGEYERTVAHYAAFMSAVASRYARGSAHGTIPFMTIWNEPNSKVFFGPAPNPKRYAQMYGAAAQAVKAANPRMLVAPGPTGPKSTMKPATFIKGFQRALPKYLPKKNPKRFINAWAHNPYPGQNRSPFNRGNLKLPSIGMHNVKDLIKGLDKSPLTRGLPVWATEFGYETNPPDRTYGSSLANQSKYIAESYHWLDNHKRISIGIWYGLTDPTDLGDWQSGTLYSDGRTKPAYAMYQRMVSVPVDRAKRNTRVKVWGRANVSLRTGQIVYRTSPKAKWKKLPGQKRKADGSINATVKVTAKKTWVATRGGGKVGPSRMIIRR